MTVLVVGPPAAGKSTTARCLGEVLELPVVGFDAERVDRYAPFGYAEADADEHYRAGGAPALHRYETAFELRALERAVSQGRDRLLDVGGGALLQYEEPARATLAATLGRARLVVLALPHPSDERRCVRTLAHRIRLRDGHSGEARDWLARGGEQLLGSLVRAARRWRRREGVQVVDTSSLDEAAAGIGVVIERCRATTAGHVGRGGTR